MRYVLDPLNINSCALRPCLRHRRQTRGRVSLHAGARGTAWACAYERNWIRCSPPQTTGGPPCLPGANRLVICPCQRQGTVDASRTSLVSCAPSPPCPQSGGGAGGRQSRSSNVFDALLAGRLAVAEERLMFLCSTFIIFIFIHRSGSKNKQQNKKNNNKNLYKTLTNDYKLIQNLQKFFTACRFISYRNINLSCLLF